MLFVVKALTAGARVQGRALAVGQLHSVDVADENLGPLKAAVSCGDVAILEPAGFSFDEEPKTKAKK